MIEFNIRQPVRFINSPTIVNMAIRLIQALRGGDLQLRRSALADLGAIGYLPAADAIAQTLAENSLKLIALKGLLERQVRETNLPDLSAGAIKVMTLMDSLL